MFILEAIPAVLLGIVVLFYMTDRPEKATWLADDEREWLVKEMNAEHAAKGPRAPHSITAGLADMRVLALALIYFGTSAGLYTLESAPQIIRQFGLSTMAVGFLTPSRRPWRSSRCVLARHSDRTGERTWHVVIACLVAAGLGARRPRRIGCVGRRSPDAGQHRHQLREAAPVGHADNVPVWYRRRDRHRDHQLDRQSRRLRGTVGDRLGQGATGSFTGGLYFVAGLLVLSAVLTLVLAGSQRAPAGARSASA